MKRGRWTKFGNHQVLRVLGIDNGLGVAGVSLGLDVLALANLTNSHDLVVGDRLDLVVGIPLIVVSLVAYFLIRAGELKVAARLSRFVVIAASLLYASTKLARYSDVREQTDPAVAFRSTYPLALALEQQLSIAWFWLALAGGFLLMGINLRLRRSGEDKDSYDPLAPERARPLSEDLLPRPKWSHWIIGGLNLGAAVVVAIWTLAFIGLESSALQGGLTWATSICMVVGMLFWLSAGPALIWLGRAAIAFVGAVLAGAISAVYAASYEQVHQVVGDQVLGPRDRATHHDLDEQLTGLVLAALGLILLALICTARTKARAAPRAATKPQAVPAPPI
jgi:hypothetical protein